MPYELLPSPHPMIAKIRYYGDLEDRDILSNITQLKMPPGKQFYLVADAKDMNTGLPDRFLEAARKSIINHPDLLHMAIYVPSVWLRSIISMIIKLMRSGNRLTMHDSIEAAEQHVLDLIAAAEKQK